MNIELINSYMDEILKVNEYMNLTRITDSEKARMLHIEDSLSGLEELSSAPQGKYVDLGSGGGFPGVPLAIATGRETLLVDSVQKKMRAVQEVVDSLEINNVSTYGGRIEDLANERPKEFKVVTARALSQLNSLMELACPLLGHGGHLICYKADPSDEELEIARAVQKKLGFTEISNRTFYLSDGKTKRTIIVFEKTGKPKMMLPRRVGMAQKKPFTS